MFYDVKYRKEGVTMKKKLFSGEISPKCIYCATGITTNDGKEVLCRRMGVMQPDSCCKKFSYDPLKRKPAAIRLQQDFSSEDFSL